MTETVTSGASGAVDKADGERAEWEYPFAVAGVNISYMLVQMLDLQSGEVNSITGQNALSSFKSTLP